jgi:hypothetical protein
LLLASPMVTSLFTRMTMATGFGLQTVPAVLLREASADRLGTAISDGLWFLVSLFASDLRQ